GQLALDELAAVSRRHDRRSAGNDLERDPASVRLGAGQRLRHADRVRAEAELRRDRPRAVLTDRRGALGVALEGDGGARTTGARDLRHGLGRARLVLGARDARGVELDGGRLDGRVDLLRDVEALLGLQRDVEAADLAGSLEREHAV